MILKQATISFNQPFSSYLHCRFD